MNILPFQPHQLYLSNIVNKAPVTLNTIDQKEEEFPTPDDIILLIQRIIETLRGLYATTLDGKLLITMHQFYQHQAAVELIKDNGQQKRWIGWAKPLSMGLTFLSKIVVPVEAYALVSVSGAVENTFTTESQGKMSDNEAKQRKIDAHNQSANAFNEQNMKTLDQLSQTQRETLQSIKDILTSLSQALSTIGRHI